MITLVLRTDKPQAELYLYENEKLRTKLTWQAHRQLTKTIHKQITKLLMLQSLALEQLGGIVVFEGPGSFTGLRIGLTVANALAYAYSIPIVTTSGQNWIEDGIKQLQAGKNDRIALPRYGQPVYITKPTRK